MKKNINWIISGIVILLVGLGIWFAQEFRFYNMESNWLFLYDWADISAKLQKIGGLSLVLSSFFTQFFRIPFVGVCVTTLIYCLSAWLIYRILSKKLPGVVTAGVSLLPVSFMFLCLENDYYGYYAHVAFVMTLAFLYAYTSISSDRYRTIFGILIIPVLYHLAGSVTVVFAVSALVWEMSRLKIQSLYSVAYLVAFVFIAWLNVRSGKVDSMEEAFTPFMYYSRPSTYFFPLYAWALIPILIAMVSLLARFSFKPAKGTVYAIVGCILSFFVAGNLYGKVHSKSSYRLIQEQYWAEEGEWDTIIRTADRRQPTYLVSYLNLALANKGLLVQNYRYYNPQSLASVMLPTPNLKLGLSLQSNVYMAWGYLGSAQKASFDGNLVTPGSTHPRLLMALIKSNIVLGAYDVAEKYITLLEKTLSYRKWATSMRPFINNPEAVQADNELGQMYTSLPEVDSYARYDGLSGDLRDINKANPSNRIVAQFYELYQILEKEGQQ